MKKLSQMKGKAVVCIASVMAAGLMILGNPISAKAAGNLDMSTAYPGITAKAGETHTFDLDFETLSGNGYDVSLSIVSIPEGWEGYFKSSGNEISKVHVSGSSSNKGIAELSLSIPVEAEEGIYHVEVKGDAGDGNEDIVDIEINVNPVENGESNFSSEYPEQEGTAGTSFSFDTTLVNNRAKEQSYSLSSNAPTGWEVSFTPSGESTHVASVTINAGSSQGLTVDVTPPETITEGEYTISLTAVSASETMTQDLKVKITGTYDVSLSTTDGRLSLDAYANDEQAVVLKITNNGNVDLENLNLSSSAPTDWEVRFEESAIDILEAGASREITAYIKPSSDSMTGDYAATISIKNDLTKDSTEFRISVKTRTSWGIFAVVLIVGLVAGLGGIFKKYGRR